MKCYCGSEMKEAGKGKYPYNCIAKDKYPDAMVYVGCEAGHTCWNHDGAPDVLAVDVPHAEIIRITETEVAKIIRGELKKSYPSQVFQVHTKKYSGGSSIDVSWTDGPALKDVEKLVGHFEGASFDGMQDLKEYHDSIWSGKIVRFDNDFLFFNRHYSDKSIEEAVNWYNGYYQTGGHGPEKATFIPSHMEGKYHYSADYSHCNWEVTHRINQYLDTASL